MTPRPLWRHERRKVDRAEAELRRWWPTFFEERPLIPYRDTWSPVRVIHDRWDELWPALLAVAATITGFVLGRAA